MDLIKNLKQLVQCFKEWAEKMPTPLNIVFVITSTITLMFILLCSSSCGTSTHFTIKADSMNVVKPFVEFIDSTHFNPK